MNNFFNNDDLIIFIDDDICPNNENMPFMKLPENTIKTVANELDLVQEEYDTYTIKDINQILATEKQKSLSDYMEIDTLGFNRDIYEPATLKLYHPFDIDDISTSILKNNKNKRIFIVLDQYLDNGHTLDKLKDYLIQISEYISKNYIGIVFYTSEPKNITTLDESIDFLKKDIGLTEEQIKNLSMYVNFINKKDEHLQRSFEIAFRRSQNNNLISLYKSSYEESINKLQEAMWDVNHNEDLFHYDYLMEGAHLDDIFYEIYINKLHKTYHTKCCEEYEKYINPVRKATLKYEENNVDIKQENELNNKIFISRSLKTLNKMYKKESHLSKCKKSDDIRFGDVFKIKDSHYMVITQDCDLSIRLKGGRKVNSINLIEVDYSDKILKNSEIISELNELYRQTNKPKSKSKKNITHMQDLLEKNTTKFKNLGIDIMSIFNENLLNSQNLSLVDYKIEVNKNLKIYSVEDIFLDSITVKLPDNSINEIKITKETISNSKEIRLATKNYIDNRLRIILDKYKNLTSETLKNISNANFISNLINIKFSFDESEKLNGFIINADELSRIGNLNYIKAHEILREFMNRYSRYSYSYPTNL